MERKQLVSLVLLLLSLVQFPSALPALAEKRVALVIGNSAYQNVAPLNSPRNDARLIAETLQELGFQVIGNRAQLDLDRPAFDAALEKFGSAAIGADVALFYYSGHAIRMSRRNFLVPISANPTKEADVSLQMVDVAVVLSQMDGAGTTLNIVLLDACRKNPFGGTSLRDTGDGLTQLVARKDTLISYAAQPGNVAQDSDSANSLYSRALATAIGRPGLRLLEVFSEVGLQIKKDTGGLQQPWVSSPPNASAFYFVDPSRVGSSVEAAKQAILTTDEFARESNKEVALTSPIETDLPGAASSTDSISGVWKGTYSYAGEGQAPVGFVFTFDRNGCSGRSEELNTFGDKSSPKLFANLFCSSGLLVPGQVITVKKTYDGTGGVSHSVIYIGKVSRDLHTITGRWAINNFGGNFVMSR